MVNESVNLNINKILPDKEITFNRAINCFYADSREPFHRNLFRMELVYEDIERNLYAHSIIGDLREERNSLYFIRLYEGIFVRYIEKRFDRDQGDFYYGDAEKLFSKRNILYKMY